jgi:hypothetical protein
MLEVGMMMVCGRIIETSDCVEWAGERMGGEAKTCLSDDFKAMETEMGVRHEGRK